MDILASGKQMLAELTGAAKRQRDIEARQKAELAQAEADLRASDREKQIAAEKAQTEAKERSQAERQQLGDPAARFASHTVPGHEDLMREPRKQEPEPEKNPEIPPRVAEHNQYRPVEFIRGPSIGGGPFSNPYVRSAVPLQKPEVTLPQPMPGQELKASLQQELKHVSVQEHSQQQQPGAPPQREPTPLESRKAQVQDLTSQAQAQKQTREQQIKALNEELGL